jgi:hypothetical protein
MSKEIGVINDTPHMHIFCCFSSAVRFSTLKKKFPYGHFDMCKGSCFDNRSYVFKEGKWLNDSKADTNIRDSHFEYGEMPVERQGARNDLADLYDGILSGATDLELIKQDYNNMLRLDKIQRIRESIIADKFRNANRDLEVTYIYGSAGTGKTRYIYDTYGFTDVYRVTDYVHPFDNYSGQSIMVFDEYRAQIALSLMLNYLDIYPLELPARYYKRQACYTKVFIISNWVFDKQYAHEKMIDNETYEAWTRRIHNIYEMTPFGELLDVKTEFVQSCLWDSNPTIRKSDILRIVGMNGLNSPF